MRTLALDIDKKTAFVTCIDGDVRQQYRISLDPRHLNEFKQSLRSDDQICMEACPGSFFIAGCLCPVVAKVELVNSVVFGQILAANRHKMDRNDSGLMCKMYQAEALPTVWVPDQETREGRTCASHRMAIEHFCTAVRNQVHALLTEYGLGYRAEELLKKETSVILTTVSRMLSPRILEALKAQLDILQYLQMHREKATADITARASTQPEVELASSLPGVETFLGAIMMAAIGDITRFKTAPSVPNYAGLTPTLCASGPGKPKHGPITKRGSQLLRWAAVEAAGNARRTPGRFQNLYQKLRRKGKSHGLAIVACARELLEVLWHVLTKSEPYRDLPLASQQRKQRRREKALRQAENLRKQWPASRHNITAGADTILGFLQTAAR